MNLLKHNLPLDWLKYRHLLQTKKENNQTFIYDLIRKKYILLQPEEIVRQLCIIWLTEEAGISRNSIQVEKSFMIHGLLRRFDIVVYNSDIQPLILIECKSPQTAITQAVFDQIAAYQYILQAPYIMVTNGNENYIARMDGETKKYIFFDKIPVW